MAFDQAFKDQIIHKALNRGSVSLEDFANTHNIGNTTIQKWLRIYRNKTCGVHSHKRAYFSLQSKFKFVIETANLDEEAIGMYCRSNGIYSHQLAEWKDEIMKKPDNTEENKRKAEIKLLREENKKLKRELHRKDKALAEASALMILKKKLEDYYLDDEES
jgi:transposase